MYYPKRNVVQMQSYRHEGPIAKDTHNLIWDSDVEIIICQTCFTSLSSKSGYADTAITVHVICALGIVFTWGTRTVVFICL